MIITHSTRHDFDARQTARIRTSRPSQPSAVSHQGPFHGRKEHAVWRKLLSPRRAALRNIIIPSVTHSRSAPLKGAVSRFTARRCPLVWPKNNFNQLLHHVLCETSFDDHNQLYFRPLAYTCYKSILHPSFVSRECAHAYKLAHRNLRQEIDYTVPRAYCSYVWRLKKSVDTTHFHD